MFMIAVFFVNSLVLSKLRSTKNYNSTCLLGKLFSVCFDMNNQEIYIFVIVMVLKPNVFNTTTFYHLGSLINKLPLWMDIVISPYQ
jgi:hypothetical protein